MIWGLRFLPAFLCLWLMTLVPAHAAHSLPIAGQDDPAFADALNLWLDGHEAVALPRLATLANQDNHAAQILLGLIDTTPILQADWLAAQPRAARLALLRAPGGLSGRNWMRMAAKTEPLAQDWLRLWSGDADIQVMLDLSHKGEARAARLAAKTLALRERTGFGAVAAHPDFPSLVRGLALREAARKPGQAVQAKQALAPGDPGRILLGLATPTPEALDEWLNATPELAAFRYARAILCPDPAKGITDQAAALAAMGGWWGLAEVGSPVAALISEERWAKSRMNLNAFVRSLGPFDPQKGQTSGSLCIDFLSGVNVASQRDAAAKRRTKKGP